MLLGSGYYYIYMLRLVVRVLQYFTGVDDGVASCRLLGFGCVHHFWKDGRSSSFDLSFFSRHHLWVLSLNILQMRMSGQTINMSLKWNSDNTRYLLHETQLHWHSKISTFYRLQKRYNLFIAINSDAWSADESPKNHSVQFFNFLLGSITSTAVLVWYGKNNLSGVRMKSSDGQLLLGESTVNNNGFHNDGGEEDSNRAGLPMFSLRPRVKRKFDAQRKVDGN